MEQEICVLYEKEFYPQCHNCNKALMKVRNCYTSKSDLMAHLENFDDMFNVKRLEVICDGK